MSSGRSSNPKGARVTLRQQVLLAAVECSGGDLDKSFTAEDLLLAAWKRDPLSWGLRGHEKEHPDSEKIYVTIDRAQVKGRNVRGGLAGIGLLDKVRERTYRLTPAGLAMASAASDAEPETRAKAERALADAVESIISHPVFRTWLADPAMPKYFRDAGHFWGIAPGTPPSASRSRMANIDSTLEAALALLDKRGMDEISARHGKILFERTDVERAREFHDVLRKRFAKDLALLQVDVP